MRWQPLVPLVVVPLVVVELVSCDDPTEPTNASEVLVSGSVMEDDGSPATSAFVQLCIPAGGHGCWYEAPVSADPEDGSFRLSFEFTDDWRRQHHMEHVRHCESFMVHAWRHSSGFHFEHRPPDVESDLVNGCGRHTVRLVLPPVAAGT
jgi:hypothetical protein